MNSMTSHVCSVASGANETRRFASVLRRAACRSAFSTSVDMMDFVAGTYVDLRRLDDLDSCFGASRSIAKSPGPMLLLRPFLPVFFDGDVLLRSSMPEMSNVGDTFSLSSMTAMIARRGVSRVVRVCCTCAWFRDVTEEARLHRDSPQATHGKQTAGTGAGDAVFGFKGCRSRGTLS